MEKIMNTQVKYMKYTGKLSLVATPIGNLQDMSKRGITTLEEADYILAEDTRHSIKLLNHYDIKKKLVSYHEHNQYDKAQSIMKDLQEGKQIALVTDAGTPGISNPGSYLVKCCHEEDIEVTSIPGPVAFVNALLISGQNTNRFIFEGFLPTKNRERKERLEELQQDTRTLIFYEAPHKLRKTLDDMASYFGMERSISFVKELTKLHENVYKTQIGEAIDYYKEHEPKGEFVVVVAGLDEAIKKEQKAKAFEEMSMEEHLSMYIEQGLSKKESIKKIAKDRNMNKREVYGYFITE